MGIFGKSFYNQFIVINFKRNLDVKTLKKILYRFSVEPICCANFSAVFLCIIAVSSIM